MYHTNVTVFRKNFFKFLEQTIKFNEPIKVRTKIGNVVVLSEQDYNELMETLQLNSMPKLKEKILKGIKTPLEDCFPESEITW